MGRTEYCKLTWKKRSELPSDVWGPKTFREASSRRKEKRRRRRKKRRREGGRGEGARRKSGHKQGSQTTSTWE